MNKLIKSHHRDKGLASFRELQTFMDVDDFDISDISDNSDNSDVHESHGKLFKFYAKHTQ